MVCGSLGSGDTQTHVPNPRTTGSRHQGERLEPRGALGSHGASRRQSLLATAEASEAAPPGTEGQRASGQLCWLEKPCPS